jgi:hypothetical protein
VQADRTGGTTGRSASTARCNGSGSAEDRAQSIRAADGTLAPLGVFATGGSGDGVPHLTSQGSVVLTGDGRHLLVTNSGSGDVSLFAVAEDELALVRTVPTGGAAPKSVAEHGGLVYGSTPARPRSPGSSLATVASSRSPARSARSRRTRTPPRSASARTARRSSSPSAGPTRS